MTIVPSFTLNFDLLGFNGSFTHMETLQIEVTCIELKNCILKMKMPKEINITRTAPMIVAPIAIVMAFIILLLEAI